MNEKIRHLREKMKKMNLDGMIISNPVSIKYLTNIDAEGTLLLTRKENIYITYTMFIENVKSTVTIMDEIIVADAREVTKEDYENFFTFCENVGFEENYVTYEEYKLIKQRYRINNLAETEGMMEKIREVKDEEEIGYIKKACEITDNCFSHLLEYIKLGMTEKDIALEVENYFKRNDGDGEAFPTIVAISENSSNPHWRPTDRAIKMADSILIDMGCKYKGYSADMTRTIFMGCILEEIKPVYDLVLKCNELANKQLAEYASIKTICQSVDSEFKLSKYDFIHALGHGVGIETHEYPYITARNDTFLKANMVVAIEPGIYLPGKYGIRIEDTSLITKTGSITLTKSAKNYIVI